MKVKYISEDNHEFESKSSCEKYEEALEEIYNINHLSYIEVDGRKWYRISSVAEFYYFDHLDDNDEQYSGNTMYDIAQIISKVNHYFPFWVSKDFDGSIMIDKKRVEVIDLTVEQLENEINTLKSEKKELESLRSTDKNELKKESNENMVIDHKRIKKQPKQSPPPPKKEEPPAVKEEPKITRKKFSDPVVIAEREYSLAEIVSIAKENSGLTDQQWNQISQEERDAFIEQEIGFLQLN